MKTVGVASCRVDLAGGTLDLWPLYLYMGGLELVNMAIQIRARAEVQGKKTKSGFELVIRSRDLNRDRIFSSLESLEASLKESTRDNPVRWLARLSHDAFKRQKKATGQWVIECSSEAPPGSGLGGSSALGICLTKTLQKALGQKSMEDWALQQHVRDLETIEIEHPGGDQDFVPAIFGGLLIVKLGPNSRNVERISPKTAQAVSDRIAILYTGQPHHSGLNNWSVFKALHEGDKKTRHCLEEIKRVSSLLASELRQGSLKGLSDLVGEEWKIRQELSAAMNAPVLGDAWNWAQSLGATACKACGAGGGGSLLLVFADKKSRDTALKNQPSWGWKWLNAEVSTQKVTVSKK